MPRPAAGTNPLIVLIASAVGFAGTCIPAGCVEVTQAIPRGALAPVEEGIDGVFFAHPMGGFSNAAGRAASVRTCAAVLHDGQALRFLVECRERQMERLRANCTSRDGDVFSDDCVELFIYWRRH